MGQYGQHIQHGCVHLELNTLLLLSASSLDVYVFELS